MTAEDLRAEARSLFVGALGIGLIGAFGAAIGGALCPVCLAVMPGLLGAGLFKRWRAARLAVPRTSTLRRKSDAGGLSNGHADPT